MTTRAERRWKLNLPPVEIARRLDTLVHQKIIGTPTRAGKSVCGLENAVCSTSQFGNGVTCPTCLAEVATWKQRQAELKAKKATTRAAKKRDYNRKIRERMHAAGQRTVNLRLRAHLIEACDLLVEAGVVPRPARGDTGRAAVCRVALEAYIAEHLPEIAKAKMAIAAREAALTTASEALRFAGKTPEASSPSRHTTELKKRLLAVQAKLKTP